MVTPKLFPKRFPTLNEIEQTRRLAPKIDPWAHYVVNEILKVSRALEVQLDRNMAKYDLTMGRYLVLAEVYRSGKDGIATSILADNLGVTRATITGLLDLLESQGLVERDRRNDDRRRVDVRITAQGKSHLSDLLPDHCQRVADALSILSQEEREQFVELLHKVDEHIHVLGSEATDSQ